MKKTLIIIGVILLVIVMFYAFFKNTYNTMVLNNEQVDAQWAQVENVYQRRADLIPNLVNTVKGFAKQEQEVLTGVVEARAKASSINVNADYLTEANLQAFQKAQDGLTGALSRLMVVVERYPELKSNQNFLELQAQLEGTENRITVERMKFNETTRTYNTYIKSFPQTMLAGMFGFASKPYFEAAQGADQVPQVEF
ncbi:MAG: LemA family protein [Bacteroidales bacterium]|jgi:LemA protein|nr:LemA family protein [Bacteroidales bacterium]